MQRQRDLKLVVVGDGSCGKTSLILAHTADQFSEQYIPTAFDDFSVEALINGKTGIMTVCDTAGEEDFSSMRPLSYPDADCFILCYSVERPQSLKHIEAKWIPEIRHFCPSTPIILVGNKKDIRDDPSKQLVDLQQAQELAQKVSTMSLLECSAKNKDNIKQVFDAAVKAAVAYRNRRSNRVLQSIMKLRFVF